MNFRTFVCALGPLLALGSGALPAGAAEQPSVKVEASLPGSRPIEKSTETAALRDYLQAWESFGSALDGNHPGSLDPEFVGVARDKLAETIAEQAKLGMYTRYRAVSHDIQFVFYSPEGGSLELVDRVAYEQQVFAEGSALATERMEARFLVVLTPAEARWRVRVFQAEPQK